MPLTDLQFQSNLRFGLTAAHTHFSDTRYGPDSESFSLFGLNTATYKQLYAAELDLASAATSTIDLTSMTNLLSESFTFLTALTIFVVTTASPFTIEPGASNGLIWFLSGTAPVLTIPADGFFALSHKAAGPGVTIDGTHKTLKITNSGGVSGTIRIFILGSA